jgi:hypothetical protein
MRDQAIALVRISSADQAEGHSLDAQTASVNQVAKELNLEIVKTWSGVMSSLKGKNYGRSDIKQMLDFCKVNRRVKYLLIDQVNRYMREAFMSIYYRIEFEQIGVKLYFCDQTQRHLNNDDGISSLMYFVEAYKAEQDNDVRRNTTISRMKARYALGYYLSHPHLGYKASEVPGIHIPDDNFDLFKEAGKLIIYKQYTPSQAVRWVNDSGYRTKGGKKLDLYHYIEQFSDRYYCGLIDIKTEGWANGVKGLHQPMFSLREHQLLLNIFNKRNPQVRKKHNPEFPLANIIRHLECERTGKYEKFTGVFHNRGYRNGKPRKKLAVYDCRDCRKRLGREKLHSALTEYLNKLELLPDENTFKEALVKVWKNQRGSNEQRLRVLLKSKTELEYKIKETAAAFATENEGATKHSLRKLLEDYDEKTVQLDADIVSLKDSEIESEDFVKFALSFVSNLKKEWWSLSYENRKRGEQILFNGKLYADNDATIHTPQLSTIYTLQPNKKALEFASKALMVELVGTAPTSAGLSWLVFYRHSPFSNLRRWVSKRTNIPSQQSKS